MDCPENYRRPVMDKQDEISTNDNFLLSYKSTEIYGIEDEKGLFVLSISLEETYKAKWLIFCMGGHIVTLTGATEGIFEFRSRS